MGKGITFGLMGTSMKVSGSMIKLMVLDCIHGLMEEDMKGALLLIFVMVMGFINGLMDLNIKGIMKTISSTGSEYTDSKTAVFTVDFGRIIRDMETGLKLVPMENRFKGFGRMENLLFDILLYFLCKLSRFKGHLKLAINEI